MKKFIYANQVILIGLLLLTRIVYASPNVSIAFVLDESGSISYSNFQLEKKGFRGALASLPADGTVELSVIGFASNAETIVARALLTSTTFKGIDDALENNPKSGGGTAMDLAITTAATALQASSAPAKVICLATDGQPNDESSTIIAANNAKNSGIILAPIGIGLESGGKTFLDSIASNPPVPNPADFTEFATVVRNVCAGAAQIAAGVTLTPAAVNFGSFTQESLPSVKERREFTLENKSTQTLTITSIAVTGQDSRAFVITELAGKPFDAKQLPFTLNPRSSRAISVVLAPNNLLPSDNSYDASLTVASTDETGANRETTSLLTGSIDTVGLKVDVIDANGLITEVTNTSNLTKAGFDLIESDINALGDPGNARRVGFVADGNARILLRVQTTAQKEIEFSIPNHIDATLA